MDINTLCVQKYIKFFKIKFFLLGHPKQPKLPLIRLRIEYTSETQHFNGIQFGQEFQGRVANSSDMILLRMEKKNIEKKARCIDDDALETIVDIDEVLHCVP